MKTFIISCAGVVLLSTVLLYVFPKNKNGDYPIIVSGKLSIDVNEIDPEIELKKNTSDSFLRMYYYELYVNKNENEARKWYERYNAAAHSPKQSD